MKLSDEKLLKKLDGIICEMLKNKEPSIVEYHYARLMKEINNEVLTRAQLVMVLIAEIAENKSGQINNERFDFYLKQLPVKYTTDFKLT